MAKAFLVVDPTDAAAVATATAGVQEVLATYGARLLVRASDAQLASLADAGVAAELADHLDLIALPGVILDTRLGDPPAPPAGWETIGAASARTYWLVQFDGPPLAEWIQSVEGAGAELLGPIAQSTVLARMTAAQAGATRALGPVQWVGRHESLYVVEPALAGETGPVPAAEMARLTDAATPAAERLEITVSVFDAAELGAARAAVEDAGGEVRSESGDALTAEAPRSAIQALAVLPAVAHLGLVLPVGPGLDVARGITNVQAGIDQHGLDGAGEVVAVCDSGLSNGIDGPGMHVDFFRLDATPGRVTGISLTDGIPLPLRRTVWSDPNGHGTHVAGIAVGTGAASGLQRPARGVAPAARLAMQALLDTAGNWATGLTDMRRPLGDAYDVAGARVHNNSWGSLAGFAPANYTAGNFPRSIDEFVWRNPDMVVVHCVMNNAGDGPFNAVAPGGPGADSISDLGTISPQTTARNGIGVGGTETSKNPAASGTWAGCWGFLPNRNCFNTAPLSTDRVADNAQHVMGVSGRGPTDAASGSRIKPDLVAPGSSIEAPLSALAPVPGGGVWGPHPPPLGAAYRLQGGTSMAAPHVAGMAALIRQYLRVIRRYSDPENPQRRRRRPSAALIKALLVHGASPMTANHGAPPGVDNHGPLPSNHQGWGRVDLRRTLFSNPIPAVAAANPVWLPRRTVFLDDPSRTLNGLPAGPTSRTRHTLGVRVSDPATPLRATLVWTDYPGVLGHPGSVVNQLRLSIVRAADGTVFNIAAPGGFLPAPPPPGDLSNNNVQQIDIAAPAAGVYSIHVTAPAALPSFTTRGEEQDFALVVSGSISESDERLPGTLDPKPDLAFVAVAPNGAQHLHDGLAPSPAPPLGNQGSPDIWINTDANPATEATHVRVGQRHHVFVRLRNLGFTGANDVAVHLYWADPTTPVAFPGDWQDTGISVGGVPGNVHTDSIGPRAERVVGPYEWDPPAGLAQVALLVRAVHADDPIVNEGDPGTENNLARRDLPVIDDTTQVQGRPGAFSRFIFWIISGFGSPRDIELVLRLSYQDTRDGAVKPLPAGVEVEILDHDPISADDLVASSRTALRQGTTGTESVVHLTFSTFESGERQPDLFAKVKRPAGAEFAEFLSSSFFVAGADAWESRERPADGFFLEDFTGTRHGVPVPPHAILRPDGIAVQATFESRNPFGEFRPLPAGIPVEILDSAAGSPRPHLGQTRTDAQGRIGTVVARTGDHHPSLYFRISRDVNEPAFGLVDYFLTNAEYDSRTETVEVIDAAGAVTTRLGHWPAHNVNTLVPAGSTLRVRLESPDVGVHLRFNYFDREAGAMRPVPAGTEVEVWEDVPGAAQALARGRLDANGRVSLGASRGGHATIDLFARLVMRRRLDVGDSVADSTVTVVRGGATVQFDTKGRAATNGASGTFAGAHDRVPAGAGELTFQLGVGPGDADPSLAAPFVLRVIGDAHDWLRTRTGDWSGLLSTTVDLIAGAGGSRFDAGTDTIFLNGTHAGFAGVAQPDQWNRTAIAHFYGHLVLEFLYAFPGRVARGVPSHDAYDHRVERDRAIAFAEGFAGYLAVAHAGAAAPDPTGVAWRGADNNGSNSSGEVVPAAVANTLWRIDRDVVQPGHAAITDSVNQRRWRALIWAPIGSLLAEASQIPLELYRAIQAAPLAPGDLIEGHDLAHVRQLVRTAFEANGLVFTRGIIRAASTVPSPGMRRFSVGPVARARLNVAALRPIAAYRIQAIPPAPATNLLVLAPVVAAAAGTQFATITVDIAEARETGAIETAGLHSWRVQAQDEFGAWDSFADDFGAAPPNTAPNTTSDRWQRFLTSVRGPDAVP